MSKQNTVFKSGQQPPATMSRRLWLAAAGAGLVGLGGCSLLPRTPLTPMPVLLEPLPGALRSDTLLVMLPGMHSRPSEFVTEGLVADLRRQRVDADIVIADAHLGYYLDRSVLRRLQADVIAPARAQGYQRIWLVGISLGGFGALGYGTRHGADIDGIVALAPYLGRDELLDEISRAGGPAAWRGAARPRQADDLEREVWQWLAAPPPGAPPVYLGFGREDRMGQGHRLMSGLLAPGRVAQVPGGHDWAPWRALWQQWLASGPLRAGSAVASTG
jgi:pimeloyl-ACP methyl ester carboxylesterase